MLAVKLYCIEYTELSSWQIHGYVLTFVFLRSGIDLAGFTSQTEPNLGGNFGLEARTTANNKPRKVIQGILNVDVCWCIFDLAA